MSDNSDTNLGPQARLPPAPASTWEPEDPEPWKPIRLSIDRPFRHDGTPFEPPEDVWMGTRVGDGFAPTIPTNPDKTIAAQTQRPAPPKTRIIAVSLKAYMLPHKTHIYLEDLATLARSEGVPSDVEVFVLPDFLSIYNANRIFTHTGLRVGAQDCSPHLPGPHTGDVTCAALRSIGVSLVEIGHAEHRAAGVTDDDFVAKAQAAIREGLTVLLCVGETVKPDVASEESLFAADKEVYGQMERVMTGLDRSKGRIIIAYEPVWAIGAAVPASARHIKRMTSYIQMSGVVQGWRSHVAVIYGGTAGPGLFDQIKDDCDGMFVGRRGHKVEDFWALVSEVAEA